MSKEDVYDEQINPLMARIIAICQEHHIAMVASFHVPNEEDDDLMCTTALLDDPFPQRGDLIRALRHLGPDGCGGAPCGFGAMAITVAGDGGRR